MMVKQLTFGYDFYMNCFVLDYIDLPKVFNQFLIICRLNVMLHKGVTDNQFLNCFK